MNITADSEPIPRAVAEAMRPLTAHDRCDKCGAQALTRYTLLTGELCFCGHHSRKYGETLNKVAHTLYDQTVAGM